MWKIKSTALLHEVLRALRRRLDARAEGLRASLRQVQREALEADEREVPAVSRRSSPCRSTTRTRWRRATSSAARQPASRRRSGEEVHAARPQSPSSKHRCARSSCAWNASKAVDDVERLNAQYGYLRRQVDAGRDLRALHRERDAGDPRAAACSSAAIASTSTCAASARRRWARCSITCSSARWCTSPTTAQSAQIRVRLFVMFGQDGRAAQWGEGIYENTFVKDNGVWKYNNLHGYQTFYTNYEDGWAKKSSAMFSPFAGIPAGCAAVHRVRPVSGAVHAAVPLQESGDGKVTPRRCEATDVTKTSVAFSVLPNVRRTRTLHRVRCDFLHMKRANSRLHQRRAARFRHLRCV